MVDSSDQGVSQVFRLQLSRLVKVIWSNRILILVFSVSVLIESIIKLQNSSNGFFGTDDEWTVYNRARFLLAHGQLPAYEPMQVPPQPIPAPFGATVLMAVVMAIIGTSPSGVFYSGLLLSGLVPCALYLASKSLLTEDPNKEVISLGAAGLVFLSAPFVIRMQLFLGETMAFVMFLLAIRFYAVGKYRPVLLLVFLIGFTEQFTALIAILVFFTTGVIYLILEKGGKRFMWSLAICVAAAVPELSLFFFNGRSYGASYFTQGFGQYTNLVLNAETIFNLVGTIIPILGLLGLALFFRDSIRSKLSPGKVTLISWGIILLLYSVFLPLFPGGSLFRIQDYVTLPLSILGAYLFARIARQRNRAKAVAILSLVLLSIEAYFLLSPLPLPNSGVTNVVPGNFGLEALAISVTIVAALSASLVLWKSKRPEQSTSRKFLVVAFVLFFSVTLVQASFYSSYELTFYQSILTSTEQVYLVNLSSALPQNSVIATATILAPNVAGLANRYVEDLPPFPTSSQDIYSGILSARNNSAQFSDQVNTNQPTYLLVVEGYPSYQYYTTPTVVHLLMTDSRFTFISGSGRMSLFLVSFNQR